MSISDVVNNDQIMQKDSNHIPPIMINRIQGAKTQDLQLK